jgi:acetylornithine deacetylase/succinyl-diaminopimelate desuccinylase-like protein
MPGKKTARSTVGQTVSIWHERLHNLEARQEEIVQTIREFVEIESPSDDKMAADRMGALLAARFQASGGNARVHRATDFGDNIQINFPGRERIKPVLLLGHFDTVYPVGTLENMPCRVSDGRVYGPGVLDMKSGIALMLYAIEALRAWHGALPRPVTVFLVSDEEVGSAGPGTCVWSPRRGEDRAQGRWGVYVDHQRRSRARRPRSRQRT